MSAREFNEWKVHFSQSPFGAYRDNLHAAMVVATLRNIHRAPNTKPVDWKDFMLIDPEEHRANNLGEALARLRAMSAPSKKELKRGANRKASRNSRSPDS